MTTLSARRLVFAPAASTSWFGLAEKTLRVLLVAAAPVCAVIFMAKTF
ncbi:hypothetical protein [Caulobacter soli]|nr:hypothetical protein [Caulobacter soli]